MSNQYYSESKYVKQQDIKLSRGFLFKLFLNKVFQAVVFIVVFCSISIGGYYFFSNDTFYSNQGGKVTVKEQEIAQDDKIAFSKDRQFYDKILLNLNYKKVNVGKVIGMPYSITNDGNKDIAVPKDTYVIQVGESIGLVNSEEIYGVVTKTNKN